MSRAKCASRREPREPRENAAANARRNALKPPERGERRERGERAERGERRKPQPEAAVEALTQGETVVSELTENARRPGIAAERQR